MQLSSTGRRQLQALVRLRTTSHSSGPSLAGSTEGHPPSPAPHRDCDAGWTDARISPASPRPPHNGTFIWVAPPIEPNQPDGGATQMKVPLCGGRGDAGEIRASVHPA